MRGVGLGIVAWVSLALVTRAPAATFLVTTTADTADGSCDADCSLREAVAAANAAPGADRIVLPAGVYGLTRPGALEDADLSGDLDVADDLVIAGAGALDTVIDAQRLDRAVHVINASLELVDLTVRNGAVMSGQNGGGVAAFGASLTLTRTEVSDCTAAASGGGVYAGASDLTIVDSALVDNRAGRGGGLDFQGFTRQLAVRGSTVSGNRAGAAGGVFVDIECGFAAPCTLVNTTIADNVGSAGAGGLECDAPHGSLTLANTLLAANSGGNCAAGSVVSSGHNLSDDTTCGLGAAGDHPNQPAGVGGLRWNGGPTRTHALLAASAAIDAGDAGRCAPADQRGRPRDGVCDIGAFEATDGACGDGFLDRAEACDDGNAADDDCCLSTCAEAPAGVTCADDGDPCTRDTCDAATARCEHTDAPLPACRSARRSQLMLRADGNVLWGWLNGDATSLPELGMPQSSDGTAYALCVYAGASPAEALRLAVAPSPERWNPTAAGGLHYKDATGAAGAVRKLSLRPGAAGRARAQLTAAGPALPGLAAMAAPVVVQLRNDDPGVCWESRFDAADIRRHNARLLRATDVE